MEIYPYWELLFAVLRQRLEGSTVPITSLVLPAHPYAYLLSHVTQLLKGHSVYTARDIDVIISLRHSVLTL